MIAGHGFFDVAQHKVHQRAFDCAKHFAHAGEDDVFDLRARQYQFQRVGKIFQHDDGACAAVVKLVFQFARGVKRVGVHYHQACFQDAKHGDGVLQQVGHHHGNALAARQFEHVLQIGGEVVGQLADLAVAEFFAHAVKGGLIAKLGNALLHYVYHRGVVRGVNFGVYACFVAFEPDFFHVGVSLCRGLGSLQSGMNQIKGGFCQQCFKRAGMKAIAFV